MMIVWCRRTHGIAEEGSGGGLGLSQTSLAVLLIIADDDSVASSNKNIAEEGRGGGLGLSQTSLAVLLIMADDDSVESPNTRHRRGGKRRGLGVEPRHH